MPNSNRGGTGSLVEASSPFFLYGLLYFAGTQATSADANTLHIAIFDDLDTLQIRIELARTYIVRVGNRMPEHGPLFTYITLHRHDR